MSRAIRIPEAVSLALHSMGILASRPDETISTREIAELLGGSSAHLAKVLKILENDGLVRSQRGPAGGFQLLKSADSIFLLEIYEAMEGPLTAEGCLLATQLCVNKGCIFGDLLDSLDTQFREHLAKTRLSKLAKTMGVRSA
ncbi:RrF2 family transcriptional regulator [Candidatus Zixiibacteriota bacterium]